MKTKLITISALALISSSCAYAPSQIGIPTIYGNSTEPLLISANPRGKKEGIACGKNILGIATKGDFSVEAARANGGITKITSVDKQVKNVLGLFAQVCTIVKGN